MALIEPWLSTLAERGSWTDRLRFNVDLVMTEMVVNVISYGYPHGDKGRIRLTADQRGDRVELEIHDDGIAFDPLTNVPQVDPNADLAAATISGRGILMMLEYSARQHYERRDNHNILSVTFLNQAD